MYKLIAIIAFIGVSHLGFSQYDGEGKYEASRFRGGVMWFYTGLRPATPERVRKYDRLIFDVTYNDWVGDNDPFENHWASIGLNTSLMFDIPLTKGNTVSLGVGVSHQFTNIRHNNHLIRDDVQQATIYAPKNPTDDFKKSVLGGNSFSVPLEIRFRGKGWKHFKVHLGGKIGYQANLFSKYVGTVDGKRDVHKTYGFPDVAPLIYSAHIRFGLRNWALFASYNFNKIFSDPESVQLNYLQAGLSISLF